VFPLQAGLGQPVMSSHGSSFEQMKLRLATSVANIAPPAMSAWLLTNTFVRFIDLTTEQLSFIGGSKFAHMYMFCGVPPATHSKALIRQACKAQKASIH